MGSAPPLQPDQDRLHKVAAAQEGYFTTLQAADARYSSQLLDELIHAGLVENRMPGVYRLVHFPAGDHEELVEAWLWSDRQGVFSHETALSQYELSDVLPARVHVTMPSAWRDRHPHIPRDVVVHYDDVPPDERVRLGPVQITSVRRTLEDCAKAQLAPDLLHQAARQALRRGLVVNSELSEVEKALAPFGGVMV